MGAIPAFSIFQGVEKPRKSAGITELRADRSHLWLHDRDAPVPFELFQRIFTGTRVLPFAFGFSLGCSRGQVPHLAEHG